MTMPVPRELSTTTSLLPDFRTQWFICTMATGISTSILHDFPYPARWLKYLSYAMFTLCSISLVINTTLFLAQLIRRPQYRHDLLFNLKDNVFLACGVMGYTSWVTGLHLITQAKRPLLSYVLWWIGNTMSLGCAWIVFLCILWRSKIKSNSITAKLLLPIVTLTVTASAGGVITPSLPMSLRQSTMIVSFLLWANAVGMAFIVLTVYVHRLIVHKFPNKRTIFTSFIPIGFLGQGAFAVQLFGLHYHDHLLTLNDDLSSQIQGDIFQYTSVLAGLFLESMGLCFTVMAFWAVFSRGLRHDFHFGWWAMTFPLGTMCLATRETGEIMGWEAFLVISAIYGTAVILITTFCTLMSLRDLWMWVANGRVLVDAVDSDSDSESMSKSSSSTDTDDVETVTLETV